MRRHLEKCKGQQQSYKNKIACIRGCGAKMYRNYMADHAILCPNEMVDCIYKGNGEVKYWSHYKLALIVCLAITICYA